MNGNDQPQWNSFARVNNSERWRANSAAMGRAATLAIVDEARVESGMNVLDVASGTGEPAITIATNLAGTGAVIATDISAEPLKVAETRARERGLVNFSTMPADVHALPFPNARFDRVTCRLGVMFFADPIQGLREIRRVLRPGGRASFLVWGSMRQPYFDTTLGTIFRALPQIEVPAPAAKMFRCAEAGTISGMLREAGFALAEERAAKIPWNWPGTPEDLWDYFQEVTVPFKPVFAAIPDGRRAEIDAAVVEAIGRHYDGQQVLLDAEMLLASGTV